MRRALALLWLCFLGSPGLRRARAQDSEYGAQASVERTSAPGTSELGAQAAARRPGALGEPARAVLDMPGVARSSFAGSELVLWGAAASESRSYVDGIELPALVHAAGFRTTVHPALIERVTLLPGAAQAAYGRGLGGVVDLTTRALLKDGLHAELRADAIDTSLSLEAGSKPLSVLVAGRIGYLDRVVAALAPASQALLSIPAHADGAVRVEGRPDARTRVGVTWIGARDRTDVDDATNQQRRTNMFQLTTLSLERRYADGARVRIAPFLGIQQGSERSRFSGVPLALARSGSFFGLRAEYARARRWVHVRLGIDARATRDRLERTGTLTLPAREGDVRLFGQVPADAVNSDRFHSLLVNVAPYATLGLRWRSLTIEPGFRLEACLAGASASLPNSTDVPPVGGERMWLLPEPRVRLSYALTEWARIEVRGGLYHQPPAPLDLSAVFGTPSLAPARAAHAALGTLVELPWRVLVEAVAFYRALGQLAVRTSDNPARLAHALSQDGTGAAYGGSLSLRRELLGGWSGAASYTVSRSVREAAARPARLFDADQTHVLSLLLSYARRVWNLSVKLRSATGNPRTAVVGTYFDAKSGSVQPLFGATNGARTPDFLQLDLRGEYLLGDARLRGALFVEVLNLFNHQNIEQVAFTSDFERRRDVVGLPFLAMLGGRVGF